MKSRNRILKILVVILSITLICVLWLVVLYNSYKNHWKDVWTKEEMKSIAGKIELSDPMSMRFYDVYDSLYPAQRTTSMYPMIFERYKSAATRHFKISRSFSKNVCSCTEVYSVVKSKLILNGADLLGFGLSEYTSPKKCFDYVVNNLEVYIDNERIFGLPAVANHLYGKSIAEMNRAELIELVRVFRGMPHNFE